MLMRLCVAIASRLVVDYFIQQVVDFVQLLTRVGRCRLCLLVLAVRIIIVVGTRVVRVVNRRQIKRVGRLIRVRVGHHFRRLLMLLLLLLMLLMLLLHHYLFNHKVNKNLVKCKILSCLIPIKTNIYNIS